MSNRVASVVDGTADGTWVGKGVAGVVAGLAGGVTMGVVLQFGTELLALVGRLAGAGTPVRGWVVHLATSALFGLLFAAFVSLPLIRDLATTVGGTALLGLVHAMALSFVTIGVLLPAATVALGLPELSISTYLVPGTEGTGLVDAGFFGLAHVVYGAVVGVAYARLRGIGRE